jgi:hypothetical protein
MKHPIGTKVEVWSEDESEDEAEYFGVGTIIDHERMTILGETIYIDQDIPVIMLPDGSTIRGHECEYDVVEEVK